jgi:hypothetical protein
MKKNGHHATALVFPGASGWCVRLSTGQMQTVPALSEVAANLPAGAAVHLALPCYAALFERMTLPSIDRAELSGMVQLQLEKTLPYPVEEVSSDFDVIRQTENESTLLTVAANHERLDELCGPLREKAFVPEKVTVYAQHVAAACPTGETVLCLWPEEGQIVIAVCEQGKLGYAQTAVDPESVMADLPGFLLRAEMEGVSTDFSRIYIEQGCLSLKSFLGEQLGKPVELFSFDGPLPEPGMNLVPSAWVEEMRRIERKNQFRGRLQVAAIAYLFAVALAFLYLAWLKSRSQKLDRELAQTQPLVEFQQNQQTKWQALAPVIEPGRSMVEVLDRLFACLPSPEVKFTSFEFGPRQFKLECEAPSANMWTELTEKIRKEQGLADFKIEAQPPKVLNDGRVQFQIFGQQ